MQNTDDHDTMSIHEHVDNTSTMNETDANLSGSSRESTENVDAIKKFIELQTKEIEEQKSAVNNALHEINKNHDSNPKTTQNHDNAIATSSNVMDMIFSISEERLTQKKSNKDIPRQTLDAVNSSISLSVGSRIIAKDYSEDWHEVEIIEVDYDEMEVLIRYEQNSRKHDEWVSVNSPRLRPIGYVEVKSEPVKWENRPQSVVHQEGDKEEKDEKADEKSKVTFVVGERCLARWRDNRRFVATIQNDLGNGAYEIMFDDGFYWKCKKSRLYKWKPEKSNSLTVDTSLNLLLTSAPSPIESGGPSNTMAQSLPIFHTHLFDPTRDYLGPKSERREMKRKLNIKEIFNIGQKRPRTPKIEKEKLKANVENKPKVVKKIQKSKIETFLKEEDNVVLNGKIPEAVASTISSISPEDSDALKVDSKPKDKSPIEDNFEETDTCSTINDGRDDDTTLSEDMRTELDPALLEEEMKLEKFEKQDEVKHGEVIGRMKEVINKLEDGLKNELANPPKSETKEECVIPIDTHVKEEPIVKEENIDKIPEISSAMREENTQVTTENDKEKKLIKKKKGKKLRLLRDAKVVEKFKTELKEMKKQFDEMKQLLKSQEMAKGPKEMPESFLLPGEWCCRWVNGQPVGTVSEILCEQKIDGSGNPALPRRSVQVEDKRLPPGWTKHMVRRSIGHSAGKWDVVLVSPDNHRFHTKTDMRIFLDNNPDESLMSYEHVLMDFGLHLKLSRRMGWMSNTPEGVAAGPSLPECSVSSTSPLLKKTKRILRKQRKNKETRKKIILKMKFPHLIKKRVENTAQNATMSSVSKDMELPSEAMIDTPSLEDGYVYVGSLKVQIIENLLRCPAEGCFKNFRNNTLLKMHIKHYHRELRKKLGATPKVLDLAYARTMPIKSEGPSRPVESKVLKVKINRLQKQDELRLKSNDNSPDLSVDTSPTTSVSLEMDNVPKPQDSPKLRDALINKPVKRPRVLLPVRRTEPESASSVTEDFKTSDGEEYMETSEELPVMEPLDFETAISTHTVTKPVNEKRKKERKGDKKKKSFAVVSQKQSEEDDWLAGNSDYESYSSYPGSGTPDSKTMDKQPMQQNMHEVALQPKQRNSKSYMYNENGDRIKLVRMKREEIINCHCGFREEDGLMVQCELCLCWQHALCYNIESEAQVPEKYTCSICLNPVRGRRSKRFLHDQDRMYEGLLPGAKPCDSLRRSHELSGNLLLLKDALHALRVKSYVAVKKNHPKLYLWAQDWNEAEIMNTQEKLNSAYTDLTIVPNLANRNNRNLGLMRDIPLDVTMQPSDELDPEGYVHRDSSQVMLSGLMSSAEDAALEFPISTSELEQLATTVQTVEESALTAIAAPQPEAPIENSACREQLLSHIQRCQALIDARLDSIEAQVVELESQEPMIEGDDTADHFPRTRQTVNMLMRDLNTLEELGIIT